MTQVKVLYGEFFDDHNSIYCDFFFIETFAESVNGVTQVKFNIGWGEVSDDKLESYKNIIGNSSSKLWADFISCNTVSCDNTSHPQQMDNL